MCAVVAFHLDVGFVPGGYLGVSLFFTLSGYLITRNLLLERDRTGAIALGPFWLRRARRLLPAAWLTVLVVTVPAVVIASWGRSIGLGGGDVLAVLSNVANWWFLADGQSYASLFDSPSPLLHFWSLAIEEQAYVILPLLVVVTGRLRGCGGGVPGRQRAGRRLGPAAGVLAAVSFVVPMVFDLSTDRVYYGTDTRIGEILAGVVLAAVLHGRAGQWIGAWSSRRVDAVGLVALGGIGWCVATVGRGSGLITSGLLPLTAVLSTAAIAAAVQPEGAIARFGRNRGVGWCGRASYVIYLLHWPTIVALHAWGVSTDEIMVMLGVVAAVALIAAVVVRFVERPIRTTTIPGRLLAALAVLVATIIVAMGTVLAPQQTQADELLATLDDQLALVAAPPPAGTLAPSAPVPTAAASADLGVDPGAADGGDAGAADGDVDAGAADGAGVHGDAENTGGVNGDVVGRPVVRAFGDSILLSVYLATPDDTGPLLVTAEGDIALGCGAAAFTEPDESGPIVSCDDPSLRWAASMAAAPVDAALVMSCQWELVDRTLAGEAVARAVGDPVFDAYVAAAYRRTAAALLANGAPMVLWVACPRFSTMAGMDGLTSRLAASRDPARTDALNRLISDVAGEFPVSVCVVDFDDWVNERVDDVTVRPDGSHYEWRNPSGAGEAFAATVMQAWLTCTNDLGRIRPGSRDGYGPDPG